MDGEGGCPGSVRAALMVLSLQMERKLVPSDILMWGVGKRTSEYIGMWTIGCIFIYRTGI